MRSLTRAVVVLGVFALLAPAHSFAQEANDANSRLGSGEKVRAATPADRDEAWRKAWSRLHKADIESHDAIKAAIKDVENSFELADKNIRPFVDDILGGWGKWEYAMGGAGKAVNLAAGLVDGMLGSKLGTPAGPDRFATFARNSFVNHVFDPVVLKRGIEGSASAYVAKLQSLEAKLLVDLEADIEAGDVRMPRVALPKLQEAMLAHVDAAVADVISDAATDFAVTAGKEAVGQVSGNWLSGLVLSSGLLGTQYAAANNDPFSAVAIGTGALVGLGVSKGIDKIAEAMGHDPAGQLVKKIQSRLQRARQAIIDGEDKEQAKRYGWLNAFRLGDPAHDVRALCGAAADRLESKVLLGLKPAIEALEIERVFARRLAIYQTIFGQDAPIPSDLYITADLAAIRDTVVGWAKAYRAE